MLEPIGLADLAARLEALREQQQGKCAICGSEEALVRDHDHSNGFIRGLLCNRCNRGLGIFEDSPALLLAAVDYLRREHTGIPYDTLARLRSESWVPPMPPTDDSKKLRAWFMTYSDELVEILQEELEWLRGRRISRG